MVSIIMFVVMKTLSEIKKGKTEKNGDQEKVWVEKSRLEKIWPRMNREKSIQIKSRKREKERQKWRTKGERGRGEEKRKMRNEKKKRTHREGVLKIYK